RGHPRGRRDGLVGERTHPCPGVPETDRLEGDHPVQHLRVADGPGQQVQAATVTICCTSSKYWPVGTEQVRHRLLAHLAHNGMRREMKCSTASSRAGPGGVATMSATSSIVVRVIRGASRRSASSVSVMAAPCGTLLPAG